MKNGKTVPGKSLGEAPGCDHKMRSSSSLSANVSTRAVILLALPAAGQAFGQTPPQLINIGDLIQGYVSVGAVVTTDGHLLYTEGRVRINPNMPSAMAPAIVDITDLPPATREQIQTRCAAISITSGGCAVKVEGQVQLIDGRPGLIAAKIDFL
jgi:hypothetical protein